MSAIDTILHGDALTTLRTLDSGSVNCIVTSPPYFGLRDYGVASQLGLEATPEEYVAQLVGVFREARRVLRADGTLWLNLGDSYANDGKWGGSSGGKHARDLHGASGVGRGKRQTGLKPKDLIGIPWRVAFALQEDGWWLRSDIIWAKPNCMPESVTDRPTRSHEYIFLLAKSERYYYDANAVREPLKSTPEEYARAAKSVRANHAYGAVAGSPLGKRSFLNVPTSRNRRDVWSVATSPYKGAHFAVMPLPLVEPCILAGCPTGGVILDPFMGAGTVAVAARRHSRHYLGVELNADYIALAETRIANERQPVLWSISSSQEVTA